MKFYNYPSELPFKIPDIGQPAIAHLKKLNFEPDNNSEPEYPIKSILSNKYTSFMRIYYQTICKDVYSAKETLNIYLKATI